MANGNTSFMVYSVQSQLINFKRILTRFGRYLSSEALIFSWKCWTTSRRTLLVRHVFGPFSSSKYNTTFSRPAVAAKCKQVPSNCLFNKNAPELCCVTSHPSVTCHDVTGSVARWRAILLSSQEAETSSRRVSSSSKTSNIVYVSKLLSQLTRTTCASTHGSKRQHLPRPLKKLISKSSSAFLNEKGSSSKITPWPQAQRRSISLSTFSMEKSRLIWGFRLFYVFCLSKYAFTPPKANFFRIRGLISYVPLGQTRTKKRKSFSSHLRVY